MVCPMMSIEELKIGQKEEFDFFLGEEEHNNFTKQIGDTSPIHTKKEFAIEKKFEDKIAYGFNVISHLSKFYGNVLPGGSSICLNQEVKFSKPIYLNQFLKIEGEIIKIDKNLKIVTMKNKIFDEKGNLCISGKGIVRVII
ncbi:hypothetical protein BVX95_00625 [archaeon D22]|nr:hypothetical protein BVX95_00625 [archaeon D22]